MACKTDSTTMPLPEEKKKLDSSTEEKIKQAARVVFHKKGFAATRTRDIAEEAGINLALLNYYFRSKAKLFEIIMIETLLGFMQQIVCVFNDEKTTLERKVEVIAATYIDLIIKEPEIPLFLVSEIRNNAGALLEKLPFKQIVRSSVFMKQHQEAVAAGRIAEPNPLHFLMNLLGLIVFPFIARPLAKGMGTINDVQFNRLMQERKRLIPIWIKTIMPAT